MSYDETETEIDDLNIDADLAFEDALQKKIEARKKKKKEKTLRYYVDPLELELNLRTYVIARSINPSQEMNKGLALNIMKIVDEYAESGQFRGYYNGWKEEMKGRAYEHICRYCHGYNITFTSSMKFFVQWLFRAKKYVLEEWFVSKGLSYSDFYAKLSVVKIKTPNGKEKTKMGKVISMEDMLNLNNIKEDTTYFDETTFKSEIFAIKPQLMEDFEDQCNRNPFNYLTRFAYHAFIAVIQEENDILEHTQSFEDKMKYKHYEGEEEQGPTESGYSILDDSKIDWCGNMIEHVDNT